MTTIISTLLECVEQLTPAEIADPHNTVRMYVLFVLTELVRHHTLIEKLSDSRLRDFRQILEELDDPTPSLKKCSGLALRLADSIESNNSGEHDADGSAIRRLRELEDAVAKRQRSVR